MFPVLRLGPLSLPAPAFILLAGFTVGSYLSGKKASSFSVDSEIIDRILWISALSGIIGARLSFIAASPAAFQGDLLSMLSLNPALLDPAGGLAVGATAAYLIIARQKLDMWSFVDSITPFLGSLLAAYFLSLFASGNGYGRLTDLPWGVDLWGAIRHPVQLYYFFSALIILFTFLLSAPLKNLPPGISFQLFILATFSYLIFFSAFQEPPLFSLAGFRTDQLLFWIGLALSLASLNWRLGKMQEGTK